MFDIDILVGNTFVCTCCVILRWIVIIINRKSLFSADIPKSSGTGYVVLWIVFTIYSALFCPPKGDSLRSMMFFYYPYLHGADESTLHFEPIYFRIMDLIPFGYVFWRIMVWGVLGASCYIILCKLLKLDKHLASVACLIFALPILFCYQRAVAGYCLLYIALVLMMGKKLYIKVFLLRFTIFAIILFIAFQFHKTMFFYFVVLLIAYFIRDINSAFILIIIGAVLFFFSINEFSNYFLLLAPSDTSEVGLHYLEGASTSTRNIYGKIFMIIEKFPAFFIVIVCILERMKGNSRNNSYEGLFLTNTLLLLIISFVYSQISYVIETKLYNAAMLPLSLFLTLYFQRNRGKRLCIFIVYVTLTCIIVTNVYRILTNTFYF